MVILRYMLYNAKHRQRCLTSTLEIDLMQDKVIYYTETRGNLAGLIFTYCFVDHLSQEQIDAKLAELRSEGYQSLCVGTYEEFEKASHKASHEVYKANIAQPSDAQTFNEMFNILPPKDHTKYGEFELFRMCEQLDAGLYNFFVRIADKYFKVVALRNTKNSDLFQICQNAIAA